MGQGLLWGCGPARPASRKPLGSPGLEWDWGWWFQELSDLRRVSSLCPSPLRAVVLLGPSGGRAAGGLGVTLRLGGRASAAWGWGAAGCLPGRWQVTGSRPAAGCPEVPKSSGPRVLRPRRPGKGPRGVRDGGHRVLRRATCGTAAGPSPLPTWGAGRGVGSSPGGPRAPQGGRSSSLSGPCGRAPPGEERSGRRAGGAPGAAAGGRARGAQGAAAARSGSSSSSSPASSGSDGGPDPPLPAAAEAGGARSQAA